jgi:hypothetical protein
VPFTKRIARCDVNSDRWKFGEVGDREVARCWKGWGVGIGVGRKQLCWVEIGVNGAW